MTVLSKSASDEPPREIEKAWPRRGLALFDFDGTITSRDSLPLFIYHTNSLPQLGLRAAGFLPGLVRYWLGFWDNQRAKEALLAAYYKDWPRKRLEESGDYFAEKIIPKISRRKALERMAWHRSAGHRLVVVSASPEEWIKPWAVGQGLEYLATKLKYDDDDRFSGCFDGLNCHGQEKVRRIKSELGASFDDFYIYAYGDSPGDQEMLDLADEPFFKPFRE